MNIPKDYVPLFVPALCPISAGSLKAVNQVTEYLAVIGSPFYLEGIMQDEEYYRLFVKADAVPFIKDHFADSEWAEISSSWNV